jgi:hypothetical protein
VTVNEYTRGEAVELELDAFISKRHEQNLRGHGLRQGESTAVRTVIIAIGFGVAAYYFWNLYGPGGFRIGGR